MDALTPEAGYDRTERQHHLQMVVKDLRREFDFLEELESSGEVEKDNLQVYLRVRPFTSSETSEGEAQAMTVEGHTSIIVHAPTTRQLQVERTFTFSKVFGPGCSQEQLFQGTAQHLVRDAIKGRNSLLFTYGVTNAGKTFTFLGPESEPGLLPRSLALIFSSIQGRVCARSAVKPHRCSDFTRLDERQQAHEHKAKNLLLSLVKEQGSGEASLTCASIQEGTLSGVASAAGDESESFSVWVSFFEIYNENIYDLLEQLPGTSKRTVLQLSQDKRGHSFVKDVRWVQVNTSEEAYRVMKVGKRNQSISATRLNHMSSRSHSIFSIRILRIGLGVHSSELSLCDLAGSERSAQTQTGGQRLKEAGNINLSLFTLGKCMKALRLNQQKKNQQHVPFRESKLTRFIQAYFTGRGRACMLVNTSPCAHNETVNVLKFSALAQKVVPLRPLQGVMLRPVEPSVAAQRASREVSMRIDNAGRRPRGRDTIAWESSSCLEDVRGDCSSLDNVTGDSSSLEEDEEEEQEESVKEAKVRAEAVAEFEEILQQREKDYRQQFDRQAAEMAELRTELKRLRIEVQQTGAVSVCQCVVGQCKDSFALEAKVRAEAEFEEILHQREDYRQQFDRQAAEMAELRTELKRLRIENHSMEDQLRATQAATAAAGGEQKQQNDGGRRRCAVGPARKRERALTTISTATDDGRVRETPASPGRVRALRPQRNKPQYYKEPSLSCKLRPGDRGTSTFDETN